MACVAAGLKMGGALAWWQCVRQRMFVFNLLVFTIMQLQNSLGEGRFYKQI